MTDEPISTVVVAEKWYVLARKHVGHNGVVESMQRTQVQNVTLLSKSGVAFVTVSGTGFLSDR
jgi:hypothetical protein